MIAIDSLPASEVNEPVYRVILSCCPHVPLFERVSSPQDWDVLYAVESLTNPRLRDEVGDSRQPFQSPPRVLQRAHILFQASGHRFVPGEPVPELSVRQESGGYSSYALLRSNCEKLRFAPLLATFLPLVSTSRKLSFSESTTVLLSVRQESGRYSTYAP